jgi:Cu+-exporting ATPase
MHCANCALTINKYLEKQGAKNVSVNPIDGDIAFELNGATTTQQIAKGIESLGYKVDEAISGTKKSKPLFSNHIQRFWFCLPFTLVLMLHMIPGIHFHFLMNPWIQLVLCLPVFFVGMNYFARSAFKSLRNRMPNMNVLITVGATSAFIYSLILMAQGVDYLYFETAAAIITLVFFGEYLEHASVQTTQRSLKVLVKSQKVMANMIAFDDEHKEQIFSIENTQLKVGDLVLIRTGEQVPADL